MKILLFCEVEYSFAILRPLEIAALSRGWDVNWYIPIGLRQRIPAEATARSFSQVGSLIGIKYDAIFVPGNQVPYYLHGVKIQIFHGFAGEKNGHFRIRDYFDLYLTQGPYFTLRYKEMQSRHRNFEVVETGWPKLDPYFDNSIDTSSVTTKYYRPGVPLILYAPTFSRSLTSAPDSLAAFKLLAESGHYQIVVKFHPLMDKNTVNLYKSKLADIEHIFIAEQDDLIPLILIADLMVSDTSSAIYENLIAGKPAITIKTKTTLPIWRNIKTPDLLEDAIKQELNNKNAPTYAIRESYHPYIDGRSSERMLNAAESYIQKHGVPNLRQLSLWRRIQIHRKYGAPNNSQ